MRVDIQIDINRDPQEVFAYITNFENNPKWQSGMVSCTFITEPPIGEGTRYTQVAEFLGRKIISQFVVTRYIPNERIEFETTESTFPIQIVRSVAPIPSGTRVTAIIQGQPRGLIRLLSPLAHRLMRRSIEADYQRLKTLLEQ